MKINDEYIINNFIKDGKISRKLYLNYKKDMDVYNYLINRYSDSESISETLYRIYHNIENRPVCKYCGGHINFKTFTTGFYNYCSAKCIGLSPETQKKSKQTCMEKYGVEYSSQNLTVKEKYKQTCMEKYGVEYSFQNKDVKEKIKQTCMEKYGVEHATQNQNIKEKTKQTCIEKYGTLNPIGNKEVQQKSKQTCMEKYGVEYVLQSKDIKEKSKQTCMEKYGVDNPMKNISIQEKAQQTCFMNNAVKYPMQSNNVKEKSKQTCMEKYGVDICSKNNNVKEKYKQTCVEKYGEDNPMKNKKVIYKNYISKKKHNTFNSSKIEQQFKEYLEQNYPNDFEYQYSSEPYPFNCDFYIKSLDLYIEINGSWTHGGHPFDENNQEDIDKLNLWKEKNTKYYQNAINTWTNLDVRKRNTAKENKLNYLEIFSTNIKTCIEKLQYYIKL